jgi:hypothetical protein
MSQSVIAPALRTARITVQPSPMPSTVAANHSS